MDTTNATTAVQDIGTWKNRMRAFSSSPGMTGNSYHCCGLETIGKAKETIMTTVSQRPKNTLNIIGLRYKIIAYPAINTVIRWCLILILECELSGLSSAPTLPRSLTPPFMSEFPPIEKQSTSHI